MATITASGNGNWSSTTPDAPWPNGILPGAGDGVAINSRTIILDCSPPALGNITFTSGKIQYSLLTGDNFTLQFNNLYAGSVAALVLYGNDYGGVFNIIGNIIGGTSMNAYGINYTSAGTTYITGGVGGYTGMNAHGIYHNGVGDIVMTGGVISGGVGSNGVRLINTGNFYFSNNSILAGTSAYSDYGLYVLSSGSAYLTNVNCINSFFAVAIAGKPPVFTNTSVNYMQWGSVKYPLQLTAAQVLSGIAHGDRTGTLVTDSPFRRLPLTT